MYHIKINIDINEDDTIVTEQQIIKNTAGQLLDEKDLEIIISKLLTAILENNKENTLSYFGFSVRIIDEKKEIVATYDEFDFFDQVVVYENLLALVLEYSKATAIGEYDSRIWIDDETPAGTGAILALIKKDIKWMPEYIDFLRSSDLDHEVEQPNDIEEIIALYGWTAETCSLIIARLFSCHGQNGAVQFSCLLETEMSNFFKNNKKLVIDKLIEEFKNTAIFRNTSICSDDYNYRSEDYIKDVISSPEFISLFNEQEIATIKEKLRAI